MKQWAKILSLILVLTMICSVFSIGAQAATLKSTKITQGTVNYDSVDHAVLTAEQVATIIDDQIDALLAEKAIKVSKNLYITKVTIDLTSIDNAFSSLYDTLGNGYVDSLTVGDVNDIKDNRSYFYNSAAGRTYNRSADGDLVMLRQFIGFLTQGNAPSTFSKLAYGIGGGSNQLDLGIVGNYVKVDALNDVPGMLKGMLFDAILKGTYAYPKDYASTTDASSMTPDDMLNTALYNFLTKPQKYTTDVNGNKVWDNNSIISTTLHDQDPTKAKALLNLNKNSMFGILDNVAQIAYSEYGPLFLNNTIKKRLLCAVGADTVEITDPSAIAAITPTMPTATSYFTSDAVWKVNGVWYYKTTVTNNGVTANKYYRFDLSGVNAFYNMINWDYAFTNDSFAFSDLISKYGSYVGSLNHILYVALQTMVKDSVKTDMIHVTGSFWMDGENAGHLNANILSAAKYALQAAPTTIFGRGSEFSNLTYNDIKDFDLEGLSAYIAAPFLKDFLPQLVIPTLSNGQQIVQLGVLVLRECLAKLAPDVNYDSSIFVSGSLSSGTGRVLQAKTSDQWIDLLLNMGLDLGYTYLNHLTNFNFTAAKANANGWGWEAKVEELVDWAISNVDGILTIDGTKVTAASFNAVRGTYNGNGFDNINKILNGLLPIGFISNCSSSDRPDFDNSTTNYSFDLKTLLYKVEDSVTNLNLETLLSMIGRNNSSSINIFSTYNVTETLLRVINQITNCVLPNSIPKTYTEGANATLSNFTSQGSLKDLISALLVSMGNCVYSSGNTSGLLYSKALPLFSAFVDDWSGEQTLGSPEIGLDPAIATTNGAASGLTFTVTNGSKGIWRHYTDSSGVSHQDNQYKYQITGVQCYDLNGVASSYVTIGSYTTTLLDFGGSGTVNYSVSGVPVAGATVRFAISYKVTDEDGNLSDKVYTTNKYTYLSYNKDFEAAVADWQNDSKGDADINYYPEYYVELSQASSISSLPAYNYAKSKTSSTFNSYNQDLNVTAKTVDGITIPELNISNKSKYDTTNVNFTFDKTAFDNAHHVDGDTVKITTSCTAHRHSGDATFTFHFYDTTGFADIRKLADDEATRARVPSEYNTDDCYADSVLSSDVSNFTTTGVNSNGSTVTIINGATAWSNYASAFETAYRLAHEYVNANWLGGMDVAATALKKAAKDLEYCKKTASQLATEGAENNDALAATIKTNLASIETNTIAGKGSTDYMLYRWNRYTEWRDKANTVISLADKSQLKTAASSYFPYYDISPTELSALVDSDSQKDYILSLLKSYTENELADKNADLNKAKVEYASYSSVDLNQINNMITRNSARLLSRGALITAYLQSEIDSAKAQIGTTNNGYTKRSWQVYSDALAAAETVVSGSAQDIMYKAQSNLDIARNNLITVASGNEADYTELETAIAQAQYVLANASQYSNSNAEFGAVLAALGHDGFTTANGGSVQLFPNSALIVDATSYSAKDQHRVDIAADALKEALSKMLFKTASTAPTAGSAITTETVDTENGVQSLVATIPSKVHSENINTFVGVSVDGTSSDLTSQVSRDGNFSMHQNTPFAGTGSTVTYYKTVNNVKLPVATYRIVVKGDVNGDGVVDALDCMVTALVASGNGKLKNCYYLAGNVAADDAAINVSDYSAIVNIAIS